VAQIFAFFAFPGAEVLREQSAKVHQSLYNIGGNYAKKSKTTAWQNEHRARQSTALKQEGNMQNKEPEFYVVVSRPGQFGARTSADFELPASQSVINDALQKARVTNERVTYGFELLGCKRGYLRPHIKGSENINVLNELAKLLQKFDYNEAMKF
jgi:hypothetical protein